MCIGEEVIKMNQEKEISVQIPQQLILEMKDSLRWMQILGRMTGEPLRPVFPEELIVVNDEDATRRATPTEQIRAKEEGIYGVLDQKLTNLTQQAFEGREYLTIALNRRELDALAEALKTKLNIYLIDIWEFLPGERIRIKHILGEYANIHDEFVKAGGMDNPILKKELERILRYNRVLMGEAKEGDYLDGI